MQCATLPEWVKEAFIQRIIEDFQKSMNLIRSSFLTENVYINSDHYPIYRGALKDSHHNLYDVEAYEKANPQDIKADFIDKENHNIGWKLHLNVAPRFVRLVSAYLLKNGYYHKYLNDGKIEDGKVFTIYIGSHQLTKKLAEIISQDLGRFLSKPKAFGEIEFAAGVVGRFCGPFFGQTPLFYNYGSLGVTHLDVDHKLFLNHCIWGKKDENHEKVASMLKEKAQKNAIKKLWEMYGSYFFEK